MSLKDEDSGERPRFTDDAIRIVHKGGHTEFFCSISDIIDVTLTPYSDGKFYMDLKLERNKSKRMVGFDIDELTDILDKLGVSYIIKPKIEVKGGGMPFVLGLIYLGIIVFVAYKVGVFLFVIIKSFITG